MIFVETERLAFRSHEPQDEPAFVGMQTDPEVRKYVGGEPWPFEKARARFRNDFLGQPAHVYGLWATILKSEGSYVGCCGLCADGPDARVFLAFYIARSFWRQGFASEAAGAVIHVGFERLHLPRLFAEVDRRNTVSIHILNKLEFQYRSEERIPAGARVICIYELGNPHPLASPGEHR
jgi:ribosomal-protein-alanine N-acetyltransferase